MEVVRGTEATAFTSGATTTLYCSGPAAQSTSRAHSYAACKKVHVSTLLETSSNAMGIALAPKVELWHSCVQESQKSERCPLSKNVLTKALRSATSSGLRTACWCLTRA